MEIKRNIFESSARMPASYAPIAPPMTKTDANPVWSGMPSQPDSSVRHAPIPRIGEQK